jgi:hypothetical protein
VTIDSLRREIQAGDYPPVGKRKIYRIAACDSFNGVEFWGADSARMVSIIRGRR